MSERGNNIKVFVRVRPLSEMEGQVEGTTRCIEYTDDRMVKVSNFEGTGPNPNLQFAFDRVFHQLSTQQEVYATVAKDIVNAAFEGLNGTIFCYGQTASGKTFTCVGPQTRGNGRGLLPRIIQAVMEGVRVRPSSIDVRAKVTLVEIYNEKVTDLLDLTRRNLKLRENRNKGVFIEHVTERYISQAEEGYRLLELGLENRSVGCTQMNTMSSRSHMLFMITILQNDFASGEAKSARLTVVDLAGSEKISKTGTEGKQLNQAIKINTSLSALGNVIHALSDGKNQHIPYRDSKLTRLLQESLGGNSLTSLIVNVSPSTYNEAETITSLRFGNRAKAIKNSPKINKEYTVEQLLGLLEKAELKIKAQNKVIQELSKKKRVGGYGIIQDKPITLHILKDQEEDVDSNVDSNNQIEDMKKSGLRRTSIGKTMTRKDTTKSQKVEHVKFRESKNNLYLLASSLKCIPEPRPKSNGQENDSLTSEQNLLEDVEERVMARTRSQAALMADSYQQLQSQNTELRQSLENLKEETRELKETLQRTLNSLETFRAQTKMKDEIISKKNLVIERLRQKNQQRKAEIEQEINNLKKFWEKYYETDEEDRPRLSKELSAQIPCLTLKESDSTATLKNTRTAHRPKITRARTQMPSEE